MMKVTLMLLCLLSSCLIKSDKGPKSGAQKITLIAAQDMTTGRKLIAVEEFLQQVDGRFTARENSLNFFKNKRVVWKVVQTLYRKSLELNDSHHLCEFNLAGELKEVEVLQDESYVLSVILEKRTSTNQECIQLFGQEDPKNAMATLRLKVMDGVLIWEWNEDVSHLGHHSTRIQTDSDLLTMHQ